MISSSLKLACGWAEQRVPRLTYERGSEGAIRVNLVQWGLEQHALFAELIIRVLGLGGARNASGLFG